ncbi:hypothetical protein DOY81_012034, partial [Sarcophaga bullata]
YMIICSTLLMGLFLNTSIDKRLTCLFNLAAFVLFAASGAI